MIEEKLRPCPFCGLEVRYVQNTIGTYWLWHPPLECPGRRALEGLPWVGSPDSSEGRAQTEWWNRRPEQ